MSPKSYREYETSIEKKRACERLGLPSTQEDLFSKLESSHIISREVMRNLKKMRSFRNIIVHRYGVADDELVYGILKKNVGDFSKFKMEISEFLNKEDRQ